MSISHSGYGIAELAQELAALQRLCTTLANAEGPAERARNEIANINAEEHTKYCRAVVNIEDVGRRANGMVDGLEQLILGLEPRTPDETYPAVGLGIAIPALIYALSRVAFGLSVAH
jgi:hypothetical protein